MNVQQFTTIGVSTPQGVSSPHAQAALQQPAYPPGFIRETLVEKGSTELIAWLEGNAPQHIVDLMRCVDWGATFISEVQENGGLIHTAYNDEADVMVKRGLRAIATATTNRLEGSAS